MRYLLLFFVLSGCATAHRWTKPNFSMQEFYKADSECHYKAVHVPRFEANDFYNRCMMGEGYVISD